MNKPVVKMFNSIGKQYQQQKYNKNKTMIITFDTKKTL